MNSRPAWVLPEELRQLAEQVDKGIVAEVLTAFQNDTAARVAKLRTALADGDRTGIRNESHAMKGSAGQVGAPALAAICQSLEFRAMIADTAELQSILNQVEAEFSEVLHAINA